MHVGCKMILLLVMKFAKKYSKSRRLSCKICFWFNYKSRGVIIDQKLSTLQFVVFDYYIIYLIIKTQCCRSFLESKKIYKLCASAQVSISSSYNIILKFFFCLLLDLYNTI